MRTLEPQPVEERADYVGQLISRESVTVFPQVTGYVRAIEVRPGERVEAGQKLLQIDQRQEAAALNQGRAARAQAQAQLEFARSAAKRAEQLLKEGIISRQDYEQALSQAAVAEANARAAEAEVRVRSVQVQFHDVRAPFGGTAGDIVVRIGDLVTPQTPLTTVNQSDALELSVRVPIERAQQIVLGETPLQLLNDAGEPIASAPAFFVGPTPDPETQLVEVKAAFSGLKGLRAGQRVRARVVYREDERLTLPSWAVVRQSGQAFAFTVLEDDGKPKVERKPITVEGPQQEGWIVTEGLEPGEKVAVSRIQQLRDGQVIKPVAEGVGGSGQPPAQDGD